MNSNHPIALTLPVANERCSRNRYEGEESQDTVEARVEKVRKAVEPADWQILPIRNHLSNDWSG